MIDISSIKTKNGDEDGIAVFISKGKLTFPIFFAEKDTASQSVERVVQCIKMGLGVLEEQTFFYKYFTRPFGICREYMSGILSVH
mgnify:CR=1 FL=1